MKERVILHSDLNNFYASVECLYHPEYRGKPLAVLGDPKARHGIVLAKNYEAVLFWQRTSLQKSTTYKLPKQFGRQRKSVPILFLFLRIMICI